MSKFDTYEAYLQQCPKQRWIGLQNFQGIRGYTKIPLAAYLDMLKKDFKSNLNKGSKLHARLMISKLGGFRFDNGFEAFSDNRNVDISILDKNTHDHHCKWYLDPGSRNDFKVLEEHLISV